MSLHTCHREDGKPTEFPLAELLLIAAAVADAPTAMILTNESDSLSCQARIGAVEFGLDCESRLYTCAVEARDCFVVPDTMIDVRFSDDPLVTGGPLARFYAAVPLRGSAGQLLGLLCLFDCRPREIGATQREALQLIGRKLGEWFEARRLGAGTFRGNTQRQLLNRALKRAVEAGDFRLHYQPKIDLRSNRIVGLEALLRWNPRVARRSPGCIRAAAGRIGADSARRRLGHRAGSD